jgi:NAD(P)-dependent dehydrogenase (short-subunit alcohol dehydrogenase family)
MRLKNKVAIITGGSTGIGQATAKLFALEGAKVAICDINDEDGQNCVKVINQNDEQAAYWHLDVSQAGEVARVFQEIKDKFGKIDILFNNAGISGVNKPTHEIEAQDWLKVLDINLNGVFYCEKEALKHMLANEPDPQTKQRGSIIINSSIYGIVGGPDVPPYHASKGAVRLLAKTDANIYAKKGIRVNSIHPGYILTPMVENHLKSSPDPVKAKEAVASLHPLGHMGEPNDIAFGALYLASDEAKFVTGTELVIDGGYTSH